MKKMILVGLLVLISCMFAFAAEDTLTVTLTVDAYGPYAYFTDDIISDASTSLSKKNGAEEPLQPVGADDGSGNWATGSIYATIITNQTGLETEVTWTDLSNETTTTDIPLYVTCSQYYVDGALQNIEPPLTAPAPEQEEGYSLSLPEDGNHGKRAVSYKLDMSVTEEDYFDADAPTDNSNYQCTMTLSVSAS